MRLHADSDTGPNGNAAALAHPFGQPQRTAAATEVQPIEIPGDAQRCGEAPRSAGEVGRA